KKKQAPFPREPAPLLSSLSRQQPAAKDGMPQTQRPIQDKDIRPLPYGQGAYRLVYPGGAGRVDGGRLQGGFQGNAKGDRLAETIAQGGNAACQGTGGNGGGAVGHGHQLPPQVVLPRRHAASPHSVADQADLVVP